jgi:hypothetical protein
MSTQPVPAPKKGGGCFRTIGIVVVVLIGIIVVIALASGGGNKDTGTAAQPTAGTQPSGSTPAAKPTAVAQQGTDKNPWALATDIKIGEVRWKILSADVKAELPPSYGDPKKAQGKYVVVVAEVENLAKEMKSVTNLDLVDDQGRQFKASNDTFKLDPKQVMILENINPNMPYQYTTVFDVPKDATGLMVTVSDLATFGAKKAYVALGVTQ